MEKIIVTKIDNLGRFSVATFADGRSAAVWDVEMADVIRMNLNSQCEATINEYTNKANGKKGLNMRAFYPGNPGESPAKVESPENQMIDARNNSLLSVRDIQIISQCMVKCVAMSQGTMTLGQAIDMYHEACLSFEQNG